MTDKRLNSIDDIKTFIFAGKSTFTIRNTATGNRVTFRLRKKQNRKTNLPLWFVTAMTGSDNEASYSFIGTQFSLIPKDFKPKAYAYPKPVEVWKWFISNLNNISRYPMVEVWHEGRCGKCGRKLTVPESIESGIGPECRKHIG